MAASSHTRGRSLLRELLGAGTWTQQAIATALGVAQPSVSAWVRGVARPSDELRIAMERTVGVKAESWMTDAEYRVAFGKSRAA